VLNRINTHHTVSDHVISKRANVCRVTLHRVVCCTTVTCVVSYGTRIRLCHQVSQDADPHHHMPCYHICPLEVVDHVGDVDLVWLRPSIVVASDGATDSNAAKGAEAGHGSLEAKLLMTVRTNANAQTRVMLPHWKLSLLSWYVQRAA
jgi:hypothetical protein